MVEYEVVAGGSRGVINQTRTNQTRTLWWDDESGSYNGAVAHLDTISVIICAYTMERWNVLVEAVNSVQQQSHTPLEILVVIDHNPHLFQRVCEQLTGVEAIENIHERGLSGARNCGIAVARGTMLAFLDDDAIASPRWLESLVQAMTKPSIVGVGGAVIPRWECSRPAWFPEEFQWVVGCTYRGMPDERAPIRNPIGANMLVKREVFEAIGGFRAGIGRVGTLPVGCEETELCIRTRQHWPQRSFLYDPRASVAHFVPMKRATWRYFLARCYAEGRSKAMISRFVRTQDALSSERSYVARTLPQGMLRGLLMTLLALTHCSQRPFVGASRAFAITVGLTATIIGYVMGKKPGA